MFGRVESDVGEIEDTHQGFFAGEVKTRVVPEFGDVKIGRRLVLALLDGLFNRVEKTDQRLVLVVDFLNSQQVFITPMHEPLRTRLRLPLFRIDDPVQRGYYLGNRSL